MESMFKAAYIYTDLPNPGSGLDMIRIQFIGANRRDTKIQILAFGISRSDTSKEPMS